MTGNQTQVVKVAVFNGGIEIDGKEISDQQEVKVAIHPVPPQKIDCD